jgi:hypothetical protein
MDRYDVSEEVSVIEMDDFEIVQGDREKMSRSVAVTPTAP